jgi:hypothetical protein
MIIPVSKSKASKRLIQVFKSDDNSKEAFRIKPIVNQQDTHT